VSLLEVRDLQSGYGSLPVLRSVRFEGRRLSGLEPEEIVAAGVCLSLEGRHIFAGLSVRTNLELGAWTRRASLKQTMGQVLEYFPRLQERLDQTAGTLSGGEQQMLAIGRALMARPSLLMIDEASLGLAQTVFEIVHRISRDGTTVILVEQNVGALAYADQALVMEKGTLTFSGSPNDLAATGDLQRTYLGETSDLVPSGADTPRADIPKRRP
jgi:branched-chain amino acid transport system ATP-binding protein